MVQEVSECSSLVQGEINISLQFSEISLTMENHKIKFKIEISQRELGNNQCNMKGWWQNELVADETFTCKNYDSDLGLYIAGAYDRVLNGEVRNFSYTEK